MTILAPPNNYWRRRSGFPKTRYSVRAWGSDSFPDLNYETDDVPYGLHRRYPFIDISPVEPRPAPHIIPKDNAHGQEASR